MLTNWQNFYMLIGAAAATLTGLMFVATTLIVGIERRATALNAGVSTFLTPTVMNFGAVLLMAGLLSIPWQTVSSISLLLGLTGLGEVVYQITVIRRMRSVPDYQTPVRDWLWYGLFPLAAYIVLIAAAAALPAQPALALFPIGAVMVILLGIGIRNAWDLVTYLALERSGTGDNRQE